MAIYTKRGDKGKTSLFDKASAQRDGASLAKDLPRDEAGAESGRVSKDSLEVYALGAIDELNSYLGVIIAVCEDTQLKAQLKEVQRDLFTIGSVLAGANLRFFKTKTKRLERVIDELEGKLPVLKNFVLPGGSKVVAHLQYSRALSRRAEREVVALDQITVVKPQILVYLNRLSDYLFMLARDANYKAGVKEEVWVGRKK